MIVVVRAYAYRSAVWFFQLLTIHVFGDQFFLAFRIAKIQAQHGSNLGTNRNTEFVMFSIPINSIIIVSGVKIMLSHIHTQQTCTPTEADVVCHVMHHLDIQTKQMKLANSVDVGCLGFSVCILDKLISKSPCRHSWFSLVLGVGEWNTKVKQYTHIIQVGRHYCHCFLPGPQRSTKIHRTSKTVSKKREVFKNCCYRIRLP